MDEKEREKLEWWCELMEDDMKVHDNPYYWSSETVPEDIASGEVDTEKNDKRRKIENSIREAEKEGLYEISEHLTSFIDLDYEGEEDAEDYTTDNNSTDSK